jgi:phosphopantothenate-cysteine ligase
MLKGKKILVTSGGTQEYIDDVRVLTNISSGRLGTEIAEKLIASGANVTYLHGANACLPSQSSNLIPCKVRSAQDAYDFMERTVPYMDAVIHCMAVSDFTFKRDGALKCKSSDPQAFIDYMARTIMKNPKIISKVKEWNPKTILIGFKFEVGIPHEELINLAKTSIGKNGCDLVIANDKEEMIRDKNHTAYLVYPIGDSAPLKVSGKKEIATQIMIFLMNAFSNTKYVGI